MTASDEELEWAGKPDHHIIESSSDEFPELLLQIPNAPQRLFVIGSPNVLHLPSLAIVGSRNPTRGGRENAYEFARHLGHSGFSIVSGLAQGIDAAAHRGALAAGAPTVAFLGHGIDLIYPASNRELARLIAEGGALCTEFPLRTQPRREHFPQRNRLISGLCLGTLVVEAARRSGSLISARLAGEQGREIFAIPGSIHNPMSRGCHQLIRQGAKLVESADDIVSELGSLVNHMLQTTDAKESPQAEQFNKDGDYQILLDALGYDPATTDELAKTSGLTIDQVSSMLLILELEGEIEAQNGGRYSRLQT
ncbi:MAG: DNA-processing protein DprA [Woeseiaceae bacterium]